MSRATGVSPGLFAAARLSRRRMSRLRSPRGADTMILAWLMVVVIIRFTQNSVLAWRELGRAGSIAGASLAGPALTEFTMLHFLIVVFLLSLVASLLAPGLGGLGLRRLALCGVDLRAVLPAELGLLFARPAVAVIACLLVPAVLPLSRLPRSGAAMAGLVLAFLAALLAGAAAGSLFARGRVARGLSGPVRLASAAGLLALVLANFDFDWAGGPVRLIVFQHATLLDDGAGGGLLPALRPWTPWSWIADGGVAPCAALAAAALILHELVQILLWRSTSRAPGSSAATRRVTAGGKRPASSVYLVELRLQAVSIAGLAAAASAVAFAAWLAAAAHPSTGIALLGGLAVLLAGFPRAVNLFGQDAGAVRRYALAGVPWRSIFESKNAAWLTVSGLWCIPLAVALALRVSPGAALSFGLSAVLFMALAVAWGNLSSILFPVAWAELHAAEARSAPGGQPFVNQAAPFAICGVILALHQDIGPFGSAAFDVAAALCALGSVVIRDVFLRRISRGFDQELEVLLERLRR